MIPVVLVTGASRGLGRGIAIEAAAAGCSVAINYASNAAAAHETVELCTAAATRPEQRFVPMKGDIGNPDDRAGLLAHTLDTFGRLDALVNNAGVLRQVTFDEGDEAMLDELWAVNVKAPFRLIRAALPHLRRSGAGRIVTIGSTDSKRYRDGTVSIGYAMTKHAVLALSHAAKFAGWDDGVRATALLPGATRTDLLRGIPGVVPGPGRIDPDTIASAVAFLLTLPNEAAVAELPINARLESTL